MPDLTPPERRSTANGIINLFGGIGILIATLGLGWLYRINRAGPFVLPAVLLVVTTVVLAAVLPRLAGDCPAMPCRSSASDEIPTNSLRMLRDVLADNWRGVPLLLLAILFYTFGINAIETFFTLYGRNVLGDPGGQALAILGVFFITYIVASVPAGMVGERFGRRQTMIAGLVVISVLIGLGSCVRHRALLCCSCRWAGWPGRWSTPTRCRSLLGTCLPRRSRQRGRSVLCHHDAGLDPQPSRQRLVDRRRAATTTTWPFSPPAWRRPRARSACSDPLRGCMGQPDLREA